MHLTLRHLAEAHKKRVEKISCNVVVTAHSAYANRPYAPTVEYKMKMKLQMYLLGEYLPSMVYIISNLRLREMAIKFLLLQKTMKLKQLLLEEV